MRTSLGFCVWLLLAALCHADDLTVAPAPDWQRLDEAQVNLIRSKFDPKVVRLVEASRYSGDGAAVLVANTVPREMNPAHIEQETTSFIRGLETSGATVTDRQPARIGPLAGTSVLFQNQANGQTVAGVAYLVFSARDMYAVTLYGKPGVARTSPLVTSYLSRIKVDPAAVPAGAGQPAVAAATAPANPGRAGPYQLGDLTAKILIGGSLVLLIFYGLRKLVRGSH